MNIRTKRLALIFFIFPIVAIALLILSIFHWIFFIVVFVFTIIVGINSTKFNCPRCNHPLGLHKHKWKGIEFEMWSPLTKKHCDNCGYKF